MSPRQVLFTRDDDFLTRASDYLATETEFIGIIYAHQKLASIGDCVRDLELIAIASESVRIPQSCRIFTTVNTDRLNQQTTPTQSTQNLHEELRMLN